MYDKLFFFKELENSGEIQIFRLWIVNLIIDRLREVYFGCKNYLDNHLFHKIEIFVDAYLFELVFADINW